MLRGVDEPRVRLAELLVGLSLIAGLFTQAGCTGAALLLLIFYLSAIPTTGLPQPNPASTKKTAPMGSMWASGLRLTRPIARGRWSPS